MAYALDPDKDGALVWQYRIGQGSGLGGQWGAAADEQAGVLRRSTSTQTPGGMHAVNIDTGARRLVQAAAAEKLCGTVRSCNAAQGAAVTVIPGVVFSSSAMAGCAPIDERRFDCLAVRTVAKGTVRAMGTARGYTGA